MSARVLLLRGGALGDFLLTLPAIQALRRRWPAAHIELIGYPHIATLALPSGLVNRVRSLDEAGMAQFFSWRPAFTDEQRRYFHGFDLVVCWLHDPDGSVQNNLRAVGVRQLLYGSPRVEGAHASAFLQRPLETLAIYPADVFEPLRPADEWRAAGRAFLTAAGLGDRPLAIHPGSGSPRKNWRPENFLAVARRLVAEANLPVFFLLGEADEEAERHLARENRDIPVLKNLALPEVAGALSHCAGYLGNDSGITHLAAALGLPVVALFGPSDPDLYGARGPHVRIVRAPDNDLAILAPETVFDIVRAHLEPSIESS